MDIRASDIQVRLPNGKALFAIPDFRIPSGQHLLVQGESGSGKTTFLHLLAGLFLPDRGQVHLGTHDLTRLNDNQRCALRLEKVGVIFQKLNLLDHLTIRENVGLAGGADENIGAAVAKVNLKGRENERIVHLSLGEQQRVAVARVLAQAPEIILADEPTSSLDEVHARAILTALKTAAKGKTLVVVSHDLRIAKDFDRVIAFKEFRA